MTLAFGGDLDANAIMHMERRPAHASRTALAVLALALLAGCDKLPSSDQIIGAVLHNERPPQSFLDERLITPSILGFSSATDITVAQLDTFYAPDSKWRKLSDTTYVLDATWKDELTNEQHKVTLELEPGTPNNGSCYACTNDEQFIQITRGRLDGDELNSMEIESIEGAVIKAQLPLPAGEIARRQALANRFAPQPPTPPTTPPPSPVGVGAISPGANANLPRATGASSVAPAQATSPPDSAAPASNADGN